MNKSRGRKERRARKREEGKSRGGENNKSIDGGIVTVGERAALSCEGALDVNSVVLKQGSSITATSVTASYITATRSEIKVTKGDVRVIERAGNLGPALVVSDSTLYINGSYSQSRGYIESIVVHKNYTPPFLLVEKAIYFAEVEIVLTSIPKNIFSENKKMAIAQTKSKELFYSSKLEARNGDKTIYYTISISEGIIYVSRATLQVYQVLLAIGVSILGIFSVLTYFYCIWRRSVIRARQSLEHELEPLHT